MSKAGATGPLGQQSEIEEAFPGWEEPQKPAMEGLHVPGEDGAASEGAKGLASACTVLGGQRSRGGNNKRVTILRRPDVAGMLASHHAAYAGDEKKLRSIHEDGAEDTLIAADKDDLWTPAHYAAGNGKHQVLSALGTLCGPAALGVVDRDGRYPAHVAAIKGERLCLLAIQAADANHTLHEADFHGRTAAHYAALNGNEECLRVVLQAPGQSFPCLAVVDAYGKTPVDYAIQCNKEGCARVIRSDMRFLVGTSPDDLAGPCDDWGSVGDMLELGELMTGSPL
uniref:Uncharacterized protein n=1 Tax=Hemiselmis tepida TaxID=464990 RepID=A0A7S0V588_9CRYP|mmetsp:Transcript_11198/g.29099  ORF Transcript_11198/g.29099 Transcript_11198/m.29099 type:complete len:283 (+) Transcript_11198:181-1029(+)